ncbi:helix-turn-helix domain-containing protein [Paenibacillus alvei]|uniref:helix-turn-helix domain-containing protein n=1 Tax=Paenibacillus alvei TaxID=44250 RepID=UPI001F50D0DC|nr:helix-turn-helix transcriptional regulator [Paenibacillus alvei]
MNEFGEFLRELRGKRSLRDISALTELSHTYIADIEKGYRRGTNKPIKPTPETLKKLSEAYNYPYVDLMEKAGYLDDLTDEEKQPLYLEAKLDEELRTRFTELQDLIKEKRVKYDEFFNSIENIITYYKVNITISILYSELNFKSFCDKIQQHKNSDFKQAILLTIEKMIQKSKAEESEGMNFYGGSEQYTQDEIEVMEAALKAYREQKKKLLNKM